MDRVGDNISENRSISSAGNSEYYVNFELSIRDYGCGIPPSKLKSLFINFSKLEEHKKANPGGTGLGLSICKSLIEAMGGSVDVSSTLGVGTTFTITFKTKTRKI